METLEVDGNTATLSRGVRERVRSLEDLIRVCEIDTTEWRIDRWVCNAWEMGAKNNAGNVEKTPLFQVKVWLSRNHLLKSVRSEIEDLLGDARSHVGPRVGPTTQSRHEEAHRVHLLEVAIPDLHLGKLAWAPETGYSDYDVKIAEGLFDQALEALIARTSAFAFEKVVFVAGNDLLHSDTKQGTTTKGTQLDTDSRYHKAFAIARRMTARAVDRLRQIAPVTVVMVAGNHDVLSTYHLGDSLTCLFHATPDVEILNDPILRKYVQFGKVALMFTHGDKGKATDWPLVFATEQPAMFGSSLFREVHTGHIHTTRVQEFHGVRVRVSPALCPPDSWHSDNQFVGNLRGAEAYVWHKEEGLVSVAHFTVSEGR